MNYQEVIVRISFDEDRYTKLEVHKHAIKNSLQRAF